MGLSDDNICLTVSSDLTFLSPCETHECQDKDRLHPYGIRDKHPAGLSQSLMHDDDVANFTFLQ